MSKDAELENFVESRLGTYPEVDCFTIAGLVDLLVDVDYTKKEGCKVVKERPELTNTYLRMFGGYFKSITAKFNKNYETQIKFSGLLGRCMREIKNASMEGKIK
ncbi:Uncharacterised protein [uncultured archaeon]|nr:Uncharacterised protein [uncultured archaeon]